MKYIKFTKIFSILVCVLTVFLSSCTDNKPTTDNYITKKEIPELNFDIPENYKAPTFNGMVVATETPDPALFNNVLDASINAWLYRVGLSNLLKSTLSEHNGEEVWFRVIIHVWYNGEDQGYTVEDVWNFVKGIGAYEFANVEYSDVYKCNTAYLTAEMIYLINDLGNCELMLAQYPRNEKYSNIISDSLTFKLEKMQDNDQIEIAAVTRMDCYNAYAEKQYIHCNKNYNKELFVMPDKIPTDNEVEKYLDDIIVKNKLKDKTVKRNVVVGYYSNETSQYKTENISAGFNAILTKDEILSLAEDEEIKVIYLANANS